MSKHRITGNNRLGNSYRYYQYRYVVYLYWATYIKKRKKGQGNHDVYFVYWDIKGCIRKYIMKEIKVSS